MITRNLAAEREAPNRAERALIPGYGYSVRYKACCCLLGCQGCQSNFESFQSGSGPSADYGKYDVRCTEYDIILYNFYPITGQIKG